METCQVANDIKYGGLYMELQDALNAAVCKRAGKEPELCVILSLCDNVTLHLEYRKEK